jgi:N-acetylmuramoyl-L-alanine amidase
MQNNTWQLNTFAKTLWGEARGEGYRGMVAVAWVIRNRTFIRKQTYSEVCLAPSQFSCWNEYDPNRHLLDNLSVDDYYYLRAVAIAAGVMTGDIPDPTDGADHYLRFDYRARVKWDDKMRLTTQIGAHVFLKSF